MESYQVNNKIEFHGVRNTYPTGEQLSCYFTVPSVYRPEVGDFVGIYPVGWSSLGHYAAKRTVKPENVMRTTPAGLQYGKVEFDGELLSIIKPSEQYYQFIYVKAGEYIRGASTPFMFVAAVPAAAGSETYPEEQPLINNKPERIIEQLQQPPRNLEQVVEREMQKLQNGIFGLEQGLVSYKTAFPLIEETYNTTTFTPATPLPKQPKQQQQQWQQEPRQQPFGGEWKWTNIVNNTSTTTGLSGNNKHWQSRVAEVREMLGEQMRVEQAERRIEQIVMRGQLKACERHMQAVQKHEQAIRDYLRAQLVAKVADFEIKVRQIIKQLQLSSTQYGKYAGVVGEQPQQQQQQQPAEHYVRKYEQLLGEKIELDMQKRDSIMHKLRETIGECERQLRSIQVGEQQHLARFHQQLKVKIGALTSANLTAITAGIMGGEKKTKIGAKKETEDELTLLRELLKTQVSQFVQERRQEQFGLIKAHKQLGYMCNEIATRLQELEIAPVYSQLRATIPALHHYFGQLPQPKPYKLNSAYTHVQLLEKQLAELKSTLRARASMEKYSSLPVSGGRPAEQLIGAAWIKKLVQKLRELEWTLHLEKVARIGSAMIPLVEKKNNISYNNGRRAGIWAESSLIKIAQHIKLLEEMEQEASKDESRVLMQLRELKSELAQFNPEEFYPEYEREQEKQEEEEEEEEKKEENGEHVKRVGELYEQAHKMVREKLAEIDQIAEVYEPSVVESFVLSGNHAAWKQVMHLERKLVQLKGMLAEKRQYKQLSKRIAELASHLEADKKQEKEREYESKPESESESPKLRLLRALVEREQKQIMQQGARYLFEESAELFQLHQDKYERMSQLVADLELQLIYKQANKQTETEKKSFLPEQYEAEKKEEQKYAEDKKKKPSSKKDEQEFYFEQLIRGGFFPTVFGEQQQQQQLSGLQLVQYRFERLVLDFEQRMAGRQQHQQVMPEWIAEKFAAIVEFVRNARVEFSLSPLETMKPFYGQEYVREKIAEFETILGFLERNEEQKQEEKEEKKKVEEEEEEELQWTLHYIRLTARQVRELKQQLQQVFFDEWVFVNCQQNEEPHFESADFNNNNNNGKNMTTTTTTTTTGFEQVVEVLPELTLADLLSGARQQEITGEFVLPSTSSSLRYRTIEQQQQPEKRDEKMKSTEITTGRFEYQQREIERQIERQIEREIERQIERHLEQKDESEYYLTMAIQEQQPKREQQPRLANIDSVIEELEGELVKLRVQKEFSPLLPTYPTSFGGQQQKEQKTTTTTTRVVLGAGPESVRDEIFGKIVGQNLLTTVVPAIFKEASKKTAFYPGTYGNNVVVEQQQRMPFGGTHYRFKVQPQQPFRETIQKF